MSSPGLLLNFCINKKGYTFQLNDYDRGNVGALYNREAYVLYGREGGSASVVFLGPNGLTTATGNFADALEPITTCLDYPYGTATINGVTYKTFIMRRAMNIYKSDGSYWGTVAANMLVATNTAGVGLNHPTWKEIKYVQQSPNRNWIQVDAEGAGYGFVDTGLSSASGYSNIAFYGSW